MQHSSHLPEVPRLENFQYFSWSCSLKQDGFEMLTLSKIEGVIPPLPDRYSPPTYALEFVVRGNTTGTVNDSIVELKPNDAFFILADSIHKEVAVSPDCDIYIVGFTTRFAEALNIHLPDTQLSRLIMRPTWHMDDRQMAVVQHYLGLLRMLIEANRYQAVLHLVRSFIYCLAEEYALLHPQQTASLTRAEQISGQYLSLIERFCREQHRVEWYASQLHLAPKYLSNVIRQTLGISPNVYINRALLRQAKSLLSSTLLSVQEIADRLGFHNQSHFGTFFKRMTGVSPSAFRYSVR